MGVSEFGRLPDGRPVHRVTLGSAPGLVLEVLDLGATVHALEVACGDGRRRGVVLGQASVDDYLASGDYLGGSIGRYANRIARGRFVLDGAEVRVGTHDRGNHLHGGPDGFDRRLWELVDHSGTEARFRLRSPDGDQGFPGNLTAETTYAVTADGGVWAWGNNAFGQLGDGTRTDRPSPVRLPITGVARLFSGGGCAWAVQGDGSVVGWGYNDDGQLGDGTTTFRTSPVPITGLDHVQQVFGADFDSFAVTGR